MISYLEGSVDFIVNNCLQIDGSNRNAPKMEMKEANKENLRNLVNKTQRRSQGKAK